MRYCVGAALARMELKFVLSQPIPRFTGMQLCAEAATMTAQFHSLSHGLVPLPVTW
jgi:pentalenolactone synthase